jgi:hypothetical protein
MQQFSTMKPGTFAAFVSGCIILVASAAAASVQPPSASETKPSGRRVATRALQRSTSTDWPVDVAARVRALEEHAERAARERRATHAPRDER